MTELTAKLIEELQTIDTPTVCNALEVVAPERRGRVHDPAVSLYSAGAKADGWRS